jgi:hypothetical protein
MNIVDLMAILPYYLEKLMIMLGGGTGGLSGTRIIRMVRLVRVLRVLKLGTHYGKMQVSDIIIIIILLIIIIITII